MLFNPKNLLLLLSSVPLHFLQLVLRLPTAYCLHNIGNIKRRGTNPYTSSTSNTPNRLKFCWINMKLTHKPVSPPLILSVSGIMSACMKRKKVKLAGIPVFSSLSCISLHLISYVKTVASRAFIGTRPASHTLAGHSCP